MTRISLMACLLFLSSLSMVSAQKVVITDPTKGGVDLGIQGEYSGDLGKGADREKFGVQAVSYTHLTLPTSDLV